MSLDLISLKKTVATFKGELLKISEVCWRKGKFKNIAGIDEAGRGPLAGPVVAAACIFTKNLDVEGINDSKKLSEKKRKTLYEWVIKHPDICFGLGVVEAEEIDKINIHNATLEAMRRAILKLSAPVEFLIVDGKFLPKIELPGEAVIGGDAKFQLIATASIIAKFTRDEIMKKYHEKYPEYGFLRHKGYGTKKHLAALKELGPCPIHRRTFKGVLND